MGIFGDYTLPNGGIIHPLNNQEGRFGQRLMRALSSGALNCDGLTLILSEPGLLSIPLDDLEVYLVFGIPYGYQQMMNRSDWAPDSGFWRDYFAPLSKSFNFWDIIGAIIGNSIGSDHLEGQSLVSEFLDEVSDIISDELTVHKKLAEIMACTNELSENINMNIIKEIDESIILDGQRVDVFSTLLRFLYVYGEYCHSRFRTSVTGTS